MSTQILLLLIAIAGMGILVLPAVPVSYVLGGILLVRSLSDVGASTGGSLIPSSAVSAALGVLAIIAAVLPSQSRPGRRALLLSGVIVFVIAFYTLVGVLGHGVDGGMLAESVRLTSLVAVALLATRVAKESGSRALRVLLVTALPSAVVLCVGFALRLPVTISFSGRAVGTFSHANAAAAFMGVLALLTVAMFLRDRRKRVGALALVSVVALLLTESLGGLVAFAAGIAVLIIVSTTMSSGRKLALILVSVVGATVLFSLSGASERLQEFQGFDAETALASGVSGDSLGWRLINWNLLLQAWSERPLLGYGLGSTQTYVMPLGAPPHSAFVQVLVETGIVGAVVIGLGGLVLLRRLRDLVIRRSWSAATATAVVADLVVNGSESNLLGYTATMYLVVALMAALLVNAEQESDPMRSVQKPFLVRPAPDALRAVNRAI